MHILLGIFCELPFSCVVISHGDFSNSYLLTWGTPPLWRDLVKILTRKPRHASSLSLECTDFKNIFLEKIPWAPSEAAEVAKVKRPQNDLKTQNNQNYKWKLYKTRWNPKFGLSDLKNDLLTSMTSEGAQWIFSKITFLKSVHQAEKNEL